MGVGLGAMLAAVNLDDESGLRAQEIHDEPAQRRLTAELQAIEPPVAQREP
jgi:hypothetical protein